MSSVECNIMTLGPVFPITLETKSPHKPVIPETKSHLDFKIPVIDPWNPKAKYCDIIGIDFIVRLDKIVNSVIKNSKTKEEMLKSIKSSVIPQNCEVMAMIKKYAVCDREPVLDNTITTPRTLHNVSNKFLRTLARHTIEYIIYRKFPDRVNFNYDAIFKECKQIMNRELTSACKQYSHSYITNERDDDFNVLYNMRSYYIHLDL